MIKITSLTQKSEIIRCEVNLYSVTLQGSQDRRKCEPCSTHPGRTALCSAQVTRHTSLALASGQRHPIRLLALASEQRHLRFIGSHFRTASPDTLYWLPLQDSITRHALLALASGQRHQIRFIGSRSRTASPDTLYWLPLQDSVTRYALLAPAPGQRHQIRFIDSRFRTASPDTL
jgi:hypothetical protein